MLADAGYDSEPNHELLRQTMQATSIIPAKAGHPTDKLPKGKWRWLMAIDFDEETYGQRWQIESVMHMLKSRQGAELTARSNATRHREMAIMAVTHNLMIVWIWKRFYRAGLTPLNISGRAFSYPIAIKGLRQCRHSELSDALVNRFKRANSHVASGTRSVFELVLPERPHCCAISYPALSTDA